MSENFYDELGIHADASPEDVRRAYRKRALQTHPDRLPPGATAEDKRVAEEQFRKVNNAYEVLMDSKNRKLYDLYGVWPPPEELPEKPSGERSHRSGNRHSHRPFAGPDPFNDFFNFPPASPLGDPFARHHHHRPRPAPIFRDPFELFNAMFADMHNDPYGSGGLFSRPSDSFWGHPAPMLNRTPAEYRPLFPPMPMFRPFLDFPAFPDERPSGSSRPSPHREAFSFESSSFHANGRDSGSGSPQWVSEKRIIRTVNGVTQSIWKRKDRNGNEHVTYTYPDGREQYTLNGVEQPHPTHHIQDAPAFTDPRYTPPPPVIPPEQVEAKRHWWSRH